MPVSRDFSHESEALGAIKPTITYNIYLYTSIYMTKSTIGALMALENSDEALNRVKTVQALTITKSSIENADVVRVTDAVRDVLGAFRLRERSANLEITPATDLRPLRADGAEIANRNLHGYLQCVYLQYQACNRPRFHDSGLGRSVTFPTSIHEHMQVLSYVDTPSL